jgi:hypothetical protein
LFDHVFDDLNDRRSKLLEKSVCVHAFSFELCLETTCGPLTGPSPLITLVIDKYKEFDNNSCSLHSHIFDRCLTAVMFWSFISFLPPWFKSFKANLLMIMFSGSLIFRPSFSFILENDRPSSSSASTPRNTGIWQIGMGNLSRSKMRPHLFPNQQCKWYMSKAYSTHIHPSELGSISILKGWGSDPSSTHTQLFIT